MRSSLIQEQKSEITLHYSGKRTLEETISNIKEARLKEMYRSKQSSLSEWRNMLIYGNNASILKTLLSNDSVKGKVRLVYIDPPFATGREFNGVHKEEIAYSDLLKGSEFIEFLRVRLMLLKKLMAEDASIYVHIDWKMSHYVRVLMDEVFGPERFINDITRIKCNPKNFKRKAYGNIKDTILFYSKTSNYVWNDSRENMDEEDIAKLFPKVDETGRRYTTNFLHAPGETLDGATGKQWKGIGPPPGRHWRYPPEQLTVLDNLGLIEWSGNKNPRKKIFADDAIKRGKKRQDIWEFKDPAYPRYPTEKNLDMMKTILSASSEENDVVLDAFSGSGTTLIAAGELGRRWIGIDNSKMAIEETRLRLKELETTKTLLYPYSTYEVIG